MLTATQIQYLLELLSEKHGPGYSKDKIEGGPIGGSVGALQAALSIMLEIAMKRKS